MGEQGPKQLHFSHLLSFTCGTTWPSWVGSRERQHLLDQSGLQYIRLEVLGSKHEKHSSIFSFQQVGCLLHRDANDRDVATVKVNGEVAG